MKLGYIAALVISVGVFNSCSGAFMHKKAPEQQALFLLQPQSHTKGWQLTYDSGTSKEDYCERFKASKRAGIIV